MDFENAQKMKFLHPEIFSAPSEEELNNIKKDNYVKVSIADERFWILVTKVEKSIIHGLVANKLVMTNDHGYNYKDNITVSTDNVYDIQN